jgi:hypothetical protein
VANHHDDCESPNPIKNQVVMAIIPPCPEAKSLFPAEAERDE